MESLASWFQETLLPWGHWGILLLSTLDASVLPMPQVIDLAVMAACALRPELAWAFALAATVGSTAGTMVIWGVARGGRMATSPDSALSGRLAWAEELLERRGAFALLIAAVLPAPFPLKVVVLAAGYLQMPATSMLVGIGTGRLLRFGSQAIIAAVWGEQIIARVRDNAPLAAILVAAFLLVSGFLYYRWRRAVAE